jgi:hypothetical protein
MLGTVVRVVLAAALAVAALALVAYGAILISAAITGSSDTAPEVLVGFGVAFVPGAIVAGCTRSVTAPATEANFPFSVTGGVTEPQVHLGSALADVELSPLASERWNVGGAHSALARPAQPSWRPNSSPRRVAISVTAAPTNADVLCAISSSSSVM